MGLGKVKYKRDLLIESLSEKLYNYKEKGGLLERKKIVGEDKWNKGWNRK